MRTVNVTAEDIEKGEWEDCERCPIALAVMREMGCGWAYVDTDTIFFGNEGEARQSFVTPDAAADFIEEFDARWPVEPFSFELP